MGYQQRQNLRVQTAQNVYRATQKTVNVVFGELRFAFSNNHDLLTIALGCAKNVHLQLVGV
jgi:hypothetical protein